MKLFTLLAAALVFNFANAGKLPLESYECKSSESVDFSADGKKWVTTTKPFSIAVVPGGAIRLKKPGLNILIELSMADEIDWEHKKLSEAQAFPFEVRITSDKRSYLDLDLVRTSKKKESVLTLNCRRTE